MRKFHKKIYIFVFLLTEIWSVQKESKWIQGLLFQIDRAE